MTAVIIEDEIPSAKFLERHLKAFDFQVLIVLKSVKNAIKWLNENTPPDIVFMDIKLGDGYSFEILQKVEINSKIVFTTAFDEYALDAFNYNSIDYLLKPISEEKIKKLLEKIETLKSGFLNEINWSNFNKVDYLNSYLVNVGLNLKKVLTDDIVYFISENNSTFIYTNEKRHYLIQKSLEKIENEVDPITFFRINRKYIINKKYLFSIKNTSQILIRVLNSENDFLTVSKSKKKSFLDWYNK
ncbi:LytR/AlgR family response regulator transcription factor [Flavobacterium okayamense]|uniref:DNA-binding response regulator n=1 Tax=Flavobacterium okayamense TaxID=2830782 RepID=A0ABM7S925_9FLAO|nr:LytTR family DNA-binding domain-containing protein [Flavobacterium okayamense]BCY29225.1 DNA-binding response regulator [Flavobacterium okayamense]